MELRPRSYFNDELLKQALNEYRAACTKLLDPQQGYEMLWLHSEEMQERLKYLRKRHTDLHAQRRAAFTQAEFNVLDPAIAHAASDIRVLNRASQEIAGSDHRPPEYVKKAMREVLTLLNEGGILEEGNRINRQYVKKLHPKNTLHKWDRYAQLDRIYETGIEFAIDQRLRGDRAYELAKIPEEVNVAKWKFMLAYADAAYHIDIRHQHSDSIGVNDLIILSNIYARLANRERGADNEHIPDTHKYRHNPAIHSLFTLALADDMFHNVLHAIDHSPMRLGEKQRYAVRLGAMRSQVYHAALVHDIGETDGELSQGILVADMPAALRVESKKIRTVLEDKTFDYYLNLQRPKLHHMDNGTATSAPITDVEWKGIVHSYKEAAELSEKTDFLGRFFKTLECMQSQHDIQRYQEKSGAKPLIESTESNKVFSVNYAVKAFNDANWDAACTGPNALVKLAEKAQGPNAGIDITLQRMLTAEMGNELAVLTAKNIEAYYGARSPEMRRMRLNAERSQSACSL